MTFDQRHDLELLRRYRDTGDARVREQLVERFLPLARQLAGRYRRSNEPFDDLLQVASYGLLKAIDGFDPDRGMAFSTYAVPTILGELKRHFRDRTWAIRVPRSTQELALRVEKAVDELSSKHGRSPTVQMLAEELDASEDDVLEALQARTARGTDSLDAPAHGDEDGDLTVGSALGSHDSGYGAVEDAATLDTLLMTLTERERLILKLRFEEELTQREIGDQIGVSQMQVSRLIRQSIAKLQLQADRQQEQRAASGGTA